MSNKRIDQNGPIALAFHVLPTVFILAPLVVVVVASFSDKDFISMPFVIAGGLYFLYLVIAEAIMIFLDGYFTWLQIG